MPANESLISVYQDFKPSPPLASLIRPLHQFHTSPAPRLHQPMYLAHLALRCLHPLLKPRNLNIVVNNQIGPRLKLENAFSKGGLCWVTNAQIRDVMVCLWFGLPRSGVEKIPERSVMYPISVLPSLTNLKECVICGTVYVTEVDWAGREHLVPAHSDPAVNETPNLPNSRQTGKAHVQEETIPPHVRMSSDAILLRPLIVV